MSEHKTLSMLVIEGPTYVGRWTAKPIQSETDFHVTQAMGRGHSAVLVGEPDTLQKAFQLVKKRGLAWREVTLGELLDSISAEVKS